MSPETWEKYGPSKQTNNDINDGQHTGKEQPAQLDKEKGQESIIADT